MSACMAAYSISEVLEWAPKIWDSLKFEIWNGENEEFIRGALDVIHTMTRSLSLPALDWNDTESPSAKAILTILAECNSRLIDSRQRYMQKTGSILSSIASASPYAFSWVAKKFLPVMFTVWQGCTTEEDKTGLLSLLNSILQSRSLVGEQLDVVLQREQNTSLGERHLSTPAAQTKSLLAVSLVDYQRNLIDDIYFSAMTENISNSPEGTQFRAVTIKGLVLLMSIPNLLSDFEKGTIIESLNSILLHPDQSDTISREAVLALQHMSSNDPASFATITLANFMSKLPKSLSTDKTQLKLQLDSVIYLLDSLARIACTATCTTAGHSATTDSDPKDRVFVAFQKALILKLTNILEQDGQLPYANIVLGAIFQGLIWYDDVLDLGLKSDSLKSSGQNLWPHPYAWIVLELCKNVIKIKQAESTNPYIGLGFATNDEQTVDKFVSLTGDIATLALRSSQTTVENNFLNNADADGPNSCNQVWSLFSENAPRSIETTQQDLIEGPAEKCLANVLSMSLVAGVRREVSFLT